MKPKLALKKPSMKIKVSFKNKKLLLIPVVILLFSAISSYYFWDKYRTAQQLLKDPQAATAAENEKLIATVSKLMALPAGETPTIATVADKEKLKDQPLFSLAENGDKIVVYTSLKKAILYRPQLGKIIDVIPVNVGPEESSPTPASQRGEPSPVAAPSSFILRNGTTVTGLTRVYEPTLLASIPGATVVERENAQSRSYTKTQLFDLTGSSETLASEHAQALGITVGTLPPEEATTGASFLIILGTDAAE